MKIKDISIEDAREFCRKNHQKCEQCEIRREFNGRTLMCYFLIKDLLNSKDKKAILKEELKYYGVEKEG